MDKAKAAVSDFMAKSGKHDTTVHEKVAPAVTHETVNKTHHENVTTAVDREVHQDHYHHSVQPVQDREVLPEQHSHKLGAVEHRQFEHGNERDVASRLEQEAAQFKDKRMDGATTQTQSVNPTMQGEHVHHHVHETIQPVVQKETIAPSVVHTTVPIHEVHHNAAQHHSTSALPPVSMHDFKKQGGVLGGREERNDGFEGEPRSIGGSIGSHNEHGSHHEHSHHKGVGRDSHENTTGLGREGGIGSESGMGRDSGMGREGGMGRETGMGRESGLGREGEHGHRGTTGTTGATGTHTGSHDNSTGKPSLMDKLNPKVDADGDGKAGFMK